MIIERSDCTMKVLLYLCFPCIILMVTTTIVSAQQVTPEYDYSEYYITETKLTDNLEIYQYLPTDPPEYSLPNEIVELTKIEKGDKFYLNIVLIDKRQLPRDILSSKPNLMIEGNTDENAFTIVGDEQIVTGEFGIYDRNLHTCIVSIPLEYSGSGNTIKLKYYYVYDGGIHIQDIDDIILDYTLDIAVPYEEPDNDDNTDNNTDNDTNNNTDNDTNNNADNDTDNKDNSTDDIDDKDDTADNDDTSDDDDNINVDDDSDNTPIVEEVLPQSPPIVLLQSIDMGGESLIAGESFTLSVVSKNLSTYFGLENVTITLDLPEEISLNPGTMPSQHVDAVAKGGEINTVFNLKIRPGEKPQTVTVKIIYEGYYRDEEGDLDDVSHTHEIMLSIVERERFSISAITLPEFIELGNDGEMVVSLLNKSNSSVNNVAITVDTGNSQEDLFMWVGNLDAGTEKKIEIKLTPDSLGTFDGVITVSYENSQTNKKSLSEEFSINVLQAQNSTRVKLDESVADEVENTSLLLSEETKPEESVIFSYISIAAFAGGSTYAGTMFYKKFSKTRADSIKVDKTKQT